MSREEAIEGVGDVPGLCFALVGKGECLKGAKGREHHCQRVEQPAQFHKLLPLEGQLSQGRFPELQFRGSSCPSPVVALVPLWTSLTAAAAQALGVPGQVPRYLYQPASTAGASWQSHGGWWII